MDTPESGTDERLSWITWGRSVWNGVDSEMVHLNNKGIAERILWRPIEYVLKHALPALKSTSVTKYEDGRTRIFADVAGRPLLSVHIDSRDWF